MRTRNSYFPNHSSVTIPRRRNKRRTPNVVEPELHTIVKVAPMADNRTMEELLQAPAKGYGEAIVILEINADHFEIKTNLLQLVQTNSYHGFETENPHTHINNFKRITSTLKFRNVPNDVIKLMMLLYSLEGSARVWYDKEPPNSILTWEDLINKFVKHLFPPSKTTHLKNKISHFTQRFEETFGEACERFKEMLRACPHHGFTKLAQIDTFYSGLNDNDQDSLNAATGGNLLSKTTREALQIIKNKSKVRYSRNKPNVSRINTTSRENASKTDDKIDKLVNQNLTLFDIFAKKVVIPAPVKAVKESCVTCGGPHAHYSSDATYSNQPSVCVATGTYNQVAPQNRASNYMVPPGFARVHNSQNSNTIPNPKGEMKAITTQSGVAYEGPSIPTPKKERDICLIEKLLNDDPFQLPPMDLKQREVVKAKSSIEEPLELELKDLPSHLEYAYLEGVDKLPMIISKDLKDNENKALLKVLKSYKRTIAWKIIDIKGIDPRFCTYKILMEQDYKLVVQSQRRVNSKNHEATKKEVIKLLDAGMIYSISDSPWISPIHCVPKKGGITVVENENNEFIPTWLVTGWRLCIDYRKLNDATRKDHFPLPFMDQMKRPLSPVPMEHLLIAEYPLAFAMLLGHFKEGIVLCHKIFKNGLEVDRAKFDIIAKLPHPTIVKGVKSFLGHAGFYRRFIQDFSKIARPMTHLLEKETPFVFFKDCIDAFETLKKKLTEAPILVVPDWNLPFELMCDASDFAIGAVLGQ
nr:retrovirus-related Pol polyprotein from transposon 17.6 [Tanacetum cinerariifolium]